MMKSTAACLIWTTGLLHDANGAQNFGLMELWRIEAAGSAAFNIFLCSHSRLHVARKKQESEGICYLPGA